MREAIDSMVADSDAERGDLARMRGLAASPHPWGRDQGLHFTASALVVHPPTGRVMLRFHDRLERWLHVGGHAELGEDEPFAIAWREAAEETSLGDLRAWPEVGRPRLIQAVVVPVPASATEPAHEHADLRYLLATDQPERAVAERPTTPLRWLTVPAALELVSDDNLAIGLELVAGLLEAFP